jgi:hypothetical protein
MTIKRTTLAPAEHSGNDATLASTPVRTSTIVDFRRRNTELPATR